jgi:hypothetical protein
VIVSPIRLTLREITPADRAQMEALRVSAGQDLVTSIVPGPGSRLGCYLKYGFEGTVEWLDHEQVLRLPLLPRAELR